MLEANGSQSTDRTKSLRRYILGLALVALTAPQETFLRQGCSLVPDTDKPRQFNVVNSDGTRSDASTTHHEAITFANAAATAFGIGRDRETPFDASSAEKAAEGKPEKVKGDIISVDLANKKFKVKTGTGRATKEIDITANDTTAITKGKDSVAFEPTIVTGVKVDIEHLNGVALKITMKN